MKALTRFLKDEEGVTAIEYGLIAALIALVILGAVQGLGETISGVFTSIDTTLEAAIPTP